ADVAAVGEIWRLRARRAARVQPYAELLRQADGAVEGFRHVHHAHAAVRTRNLEPAFLERQVLRRDFEQMRGEQLRLFDDDVPRHPQRAAAEHHAARSVGAAPDLYLVGIALHVADALEGH